MTATTINTVPPPSAFHGLSLLGLAALALAALAAAPIASVWANLFAGGTGDTWSHLAATVLPEYVANTLWLCLGVGIGVIVVGVAAAWLVTMHDFPGRQVFEWALVLPLAVPAYVMAYTYTDLLQYVGPVQSGLRESFGWQKGGGLSPSSCDCQTSSPTNIKNSLVVRATSRKKKTQCWASVARPATSAKNLARLSPWSARRSSACATTWA